MINNNFLKLARLMLIQNYNNNKINNKNNIKR